MHKILNRSIIYSGVKMSYDYKYIKYKNKYIYLKIRQMQGGSIGGGIRGEYYEPNMKLLKDHGVDGSYKKWKEQNSIISPYCLSFTKDSKIFNYIGAYHTDDENSNTFKLIKKIIKKYKPELIIVEGVRYDMGINPPLTNYHGEGKYAIDIGKKYGAKYTGVEGLEKDIVSELLTKYSRDDILGYDFLRSHKFSYNTIRISEEQFMSEFKEHNIFNDKTFNPVEWFENTFGEKFKYGSFLEYASPYKGPEAVLTQKLGYDFSRCRDIHSIFMS
jgi:hypothetical protein